jgi:hypothetical protein
MEQKSVLYKMLIANIKYFVGISLNFQVPGHEFKVYGEHFMTLLSSPPT